MTDSLPARRVPIARPAVGDAEWQALREPLESGWLTQGPKVEAFERAFAGRHGVAQAVATSNCTTALHLCLTALGVGPGDEVIVPAFTWVATANAALYCGATPVFVDVLPETYNIDPARLAEAVTARTRAVIPVHLFGLCADMAAVRAAVPESVAIVEDAACAAGAGHHGAAAGGLGHAGCFSFHPRKSITTGEGGMITTDDAVLAERCRCLRNHGASVPEEVRHHGPRPYLLPDFDELGFNYRMTDLQGAIGLVQLSKLDRFIAERARWAAWYDRALADIAWLKPPTVAAHQVHAWQAYVAVIDEATAPAPRNELMARLEVRGIATRPGTHAVTELGFYRRRFRLQQGQFPVARRLQDQSIALPLHNRMSANDFAYVAEALHAL
ncbi:MAG: DegT/DnrJ/EryC1/StrS family aminotransferase [Alphaproteobacteria bacterium]|nr:DegT/DnrJ/EryC1/StrS family aminotransferase [Alphaproteobacteria bacterium]